MARTIANLTNIVSPTLIGLLIANTLEVKVIVFWISSTSSRKFRNFVDLMGRIGHTSWHEFYRPLLLYGFWTIVPVGAG